MQITSKPSLDTFLAPRGASQVASGNGDNASFARLMQQRREQAAVPAPSTTPARSSTRDASDPTYNLSPRQTASASDAQAASSRDANNGTSDGDSAKTRSGESDATRSTTDAHMLVARKAQSAKLGKPVDAKDGATTDRASTTDPVPSNDSNDSTGATGTSPADWAAQWAGITPKQAPVPEPAEVADGAAAATTPPARTPGTSPVIGQAIGLDAGGKQATIGIIAPDDPRSPVGSPVAADENPISLTPTDQVALKTDKPATVAADDATGLTMLQGSAMAAIEARKDDKAATHDATTGNDTAVGAATAVAGSTLAQPQTSEVPTVQIATPVHAPEFKEALGVQISLMAKNGVQHAELHLNPSDMGPISVHIATEGTQARVDFGADSAATRHILEAGLPELASALQSAGMTLTGGGVSQHAQGNAQNHSQGSDQRDDSGGSRRVTMGFEGSAHIGTSTIPRTPPQGTLDLYA